MKNMDFTFVIPVYNMESYVSDCLRSVISQKGTSYNYEVIVIDDGSKDRSLDVIKEIAQTDARIKVIHQENQGLSVSRNNGLDVAQGKYIWFVDSDDWISSDALSLVEKRLREHPVDALLFSVTKVTGKEKTIVPDRKGMANVELTGREVLLSRQFPCQVQYTIYNRDYLLKNNLRMMPGIYHEDSEFSPRSYYRLETVGFLEDVIYFRRENPNSITHTVNPKRIFDLIKVAESLLHFMDEAVDKKDKPKFCDLISSVIHSALYNFNKVDAGSLKLFSNLLIEKKRLFKVMQGASLTHYRLEGYVFYLAPSLAPVIYKLLNPHIAVKGKIIQK